MAKQKQDDQLEHTYSSYVRIRYVALEPWRPARGDELLGEVAREGYPCQRHNMMLMKMISTNSPDYILAHSAKTCSSYMILNFKY